MTMTMVDEGVAGSVHAGGPYGLPGAPDAVAVVCLAHPGTVLVHLDGPCQCFFGGPGPVFRDALDRVLTFR